MDNNVYSSIVEQLNDRTKTLHTEAIKLVESFLNTIKENNYDVEKCILPVVTNSEYDGIPNISWYNKLEQREIEYNEIMSRHIIDDNHPLWYVKLLEKTEKGFKYIREEIDFVISVFKKVNYWQSMYETDDFEFNI
jgi:hypothetical protein